MPSLVLEDYVLRVIENQYRLFTFLNLSGGEWQFHADLISGTVAFRARGAAEPLLENRAFLLGTLSNRDRTFLWGWANSSIDTASPHFTVLRKQAEHTGPTVFAEQDPIPLSDEREAIALAVIATGYLGAFTFYSGGYEEGTAFLAIERCPELEGMQTDVRTKNAVIKMALQTLSFEHRLAIRAYLGYPIRTEGDTEVFVVNGEPLAVTFDRKGRIIDMQFPSQYERPLHRPVRTATEPSPAPRSRSPIGFVRKLLGAR